MSLRNYNPLQSGTPPIVQIEQVSQEKIAWYLSFSYIFNAHISRVNYITGMMSQMLYVLTLLTLNEFIFRHLWNALCHLSGVERPNDFKKFEITVFLHFYVYLMAS